MFVPNPSTAKLKELEIYVDSIILPELADIFYDFHYSFEVWYNHLTADQQLEIDRIQHDTILKRNCSIFCKGEKQQYDNPPPKNRCISALNDNHKYVMGPIIYSMEQYVKKMKGYGGGQNWDDLATTLNDWRNKDYKLIQSDISGMDRSIKMELKNIIFHKIYQLIEQYVYHVPIEVFRVHAYPVRTTMLAKIFTKDGLVDFGHANIEGTVFSGSCDTTLMNTLVTVILNRFTFERTLGLHSDDYDLKCKGDDNMAGVPRHINNYTYVDAFSQNYYFSTQVKNSLANLYGQHGFGLTMKFLQCSDNLDDADFCSTNSFYCYTCKTFRITRRLDRFIELTPWSSAVIPLTQQQRKAYKGNLYLSNLKWMRGLSIFTQLNNRLNTGSTELVGLFGRTKKNITT